MQQQNRDEPLTKFDYGWHHGHSVARLDTKSALADNISVPSTPVFGLLLNDKTICIRYKAHPPVSINISSARKEDGSPNTPFYPSELDFDKFRRAVIDMIDEEVEDIEIWALNLAGDCPVFFKISNAVRLSSAITCYFNTPADLLPPNTSFFTIQDKGNLPPQVCRKRGHSVESAEARKRQLRDSSEVSEQSKASEASADDVEMRGAEDIHGDTSTVITIHSDSEHEGNAPSTTQPRKNEPKISSKEAHTNGSNSGGNTAETTPQGWDGVHIQIAPPIPKPTTAASTARFRMGEKVPAMSFDGHDLQGQTVNDGGNSVGGSADGEDRVNELHAETTDSSVFEHMSPEDWNIVTEFFEINDIADDIAADTRLYFPGLKSTIAPYQLVAAFFHLSRSGLDYECRGGYLADKMGFGKTIETLLFITLFRLVKMAKDEVENCQEADEPEHNPARAKIGTPCPSRSKIDGKSKWPFACPCEKGPASHMELSNGPSLILAPAGLVGNWQAEFEKHMDYKNKLNGKICLLVQGLKGQEVHDCNTRNTYGIYAYIDETHTRRLQYVDNEDDTVSPPNDVTNIIVLMSKSLVSNTLYRPKKKEKSMEKILWANIVIDETHTHKSPNTDTFKSLFNQPDFTYILFLSATPWDKSPKDILPPLKIIQRQFYEFKLNEHKKWVCARKLNKIKQASEHLRDIGAWHIETAALHWAKVINACKGTTFASAGPTIQKESDTASSLMKQVLKDIMVRRSEKTIWRGLPLIRMPKHEHYDVEVKLDDPAIMADLNTYVEQLESKEIDGLQRQWDATNEGVANPTTERPKTIKQRNWMSMMRQARFYACFPHLLQLKLPNKVTLVEEISKYVESDEAEKGSWAYKHLDLIDKSPKIQCLKTLLNHLEPTEAMPIFTAGATECFATYMWIKYKYKNGTAEYFHSGLSKADRTAIVNRFMRANDSPTRTRFILGRMETLGVGFTLTRAKRCFLLQPEWLRTFEEQAIGRVWRTILVQMAEVIVARHDARGVMSNDIYNTGDALENDEEDEE